MKLFRKKNSTKRQPLARPLRIGLFALMFLAVLMMGARVRDIVAQIAHGETPSVLSPAKAAEDVKPDDKKAEAPKADAPKADTPKPDAPKADAPKAATPADDKKTDNKKIEEMKAEETKPAAAPAAVGTVPPAPAAAPAPETKPDDKKAEAPKADDKKPDDKASAASKDLAPAPEVEDPSLEGPDLSESEINVLRHLSQRRKELDKKGSELDQRETLLNVTEQRVDKKITDLKQMQEDIRKVLGEADAGHKAQVASMVKIYETMKPKDAARIFENMDTPSLVEVVSRMKEAKAAPVLASMNPAKAKEVTTALMAKKALPPAP